LAVSGGIRPHKYLWSNHSRDSVAKHLRAGNYTVVVYDSACAYDTLHFSIVSPPALFDSVHVVSPAICNGVCNGQAFVFARGGRPPLRYTWSNGDTSISEKGLCPGKDFVVVQDSGCTADTLWFTEPAIKILHMGKAFTWPALCYDSCNGRGLVPAATGGYPPYRYHWSNGKDSAYVHGLCAGVNIATAFDSLGCFVRDTVLVKRPDTVSVVLDSVAAHCINSDGRVSIIGITGGTTPYLYLWDNGMHGDSALDLHMGPHTLQVTDSHRCVYHYHYVLPGVWPHVTAAPDTDIYYGSTITLRASGAFTYLWNPATYLNCDTCRRPVFNGVLNTLYCVTGTDSFGCTDSACIHIVIRHDCGIPFMPTAFTPNGDHLDDIFHVLGNCLATAHMTVFNRWGERVFESTELHEGWDGTHQGQTCPQDVYMWQVDVTNLFGEAFHLKGDVTIIR
jgi:gliding motility-associated-like protein